MSDAETLDRMVYELRRLRDATCEPKRNTNPRYLRFSSAVSALLWLADDLRAEAAASRD
jgi:hypothetical protein